jgi:putative ABC transport system permease protein
VVLFAVQYANNARKPLGYDIDRLWSISVDRKESDREPAVKARHRETYRQLLLSFREMPQIEMAAMGFTLPYTNASWGGAMRLRGGRSFDYGSNSVTDDYAEVLRMRLVAGRWFSREDDAATWQPVVINRQMAEEIFGHENAVGRIIDEERDPNGPPPGLDEKPEVKRVVGVFEDFRQMGELSMPQPFLFHRMWLDDGKPEGALQDRIVIRLRAGTQASFEETLVKRALAVAPDWSFEVQALDTMRERKLRQYYVPLMAIGTVAGFLLLMVGMGLTGVVWQSVTQRTREFGLRRAKGATAVGVQRQVLLELVIMTSIALAVGAAIVAQLPLLSLQRRLIGIPPGVLLGSVALSMAAIYLLTLLCGWYPSRLATKVQPADALHYE